jgi:zinc transport system permease protein
MGPDTRTRTAKRPAMDDFLWRALFAGLGVAIVAGPFGCFVVWRGLAYYGETLAHTALFGVAIGLWLSIDVIWGMLGATVLAGLALGLGRGQRRLAGDTLLGILASTALAAGLVTVAAVPGVRVDLMAYLFGDILATRAIDLALLWGGGAVALAILAAIWRQALSATVHEELARIDGVRTQAVNLALMVLIALVIGVAARVVGVLLVVALLVIPAAAARRFARTPEAMALLAMLAGAVAVAAGLFGSLKFDTATGPSMVLAAALICLAAWLVPAGAKPPSPSRRGP